MVTGATNDMGREFISHFNTRGFHVVMIDSNTEGLQALREEISKGSCSPDAKIEAIKFDLKKSNHWQDYEELCK